MAAAGFEQADLVRVPPCSLGCGGCLQKVKVQGRFKLPGES